METPHEKENCSYTPLGDLTKLPNYATLTTKKYMAVSNEDRRRI